MSTAVDISCNIVQLGMGIHKAEFVLVPLLGFAVDRCHRFELPLRGRLRLQNGDGPGAQACVIQFEHHPIAQGPIHGVLLLPLSAPCPSVTDARRLYVGSYAQAIAVEQDPVAAINALGLDERATLADTTDSSPQQASADIVQDLLSRTWTSEPEDASSASRELSSFADAVLSACSTAAADGQVSLSAVPHVLCYAAMVRSTIPRL